VYVQGLALTYTLVGVIAGLTGALLTVWLQQPWVVLAAAALMVVLAMSMFGLFNIQLPNSVQSYFQNQSNKLSGGKIISVFIMGILSALIVGPCVAPPLAFALGYIGQTGDAV
ncbi:cytochrome c biogenesis protein CcdA, partial [Neisseria sp. P0015.S004]